jgi:hypothetical protein
MHTLALQIANLQALEFRGSRSAASLELNKRTQELNKRTQQTN